MLWISRIFMGVSVVMLVFLAYLLAVDLKERFIRTIETTAIVVVNNLVAAVYKDYKTAAIVSIAMKRTGGKPTVEDLKATARAFKRVEEAAR